MDKDFDGLIKRECRICFYDLHLSAAYCQCSPDKYACLNHAKQLCTCSWSTKTFLFRYEMGNLDFLVQALEGKLSAVYRWAKDDLGLVLSHVAKNHLEMCGFVNNPSVTELKQERKCPDKVLKSQDVMGPNGISKNSITQISQMNTPAVFQTLEKLKKKEKAVAAFVSASGTAEDAYSTQKENPCTIIPSEGSSSSSSSGSDEDISDYFLFRKRPCPFSAYESNPPVSRLKKEALLAVKLPTDDSSQHNIAQQFISSSTVGHLSDVILLSDDDDES